MKDISDLITRIRDYINNPRKQYILLQDNADWNQLCSSMDIIQDIELALDASVAFKGEITHGKCYLNIFGTLQALYVQQDAIKHLAEALVIKIPNEEILNNIREIRNDSIGHPTKRGRGKAFNFIARFSLAPLGYHLMTNFPDGKSISKNINVKKLIESQRDVLRIILVEIIANLNEEEMKHREDYKKIKMVDIFPKSRSYFFEKIGGAIHSNEPQQLAVTIVKQFIETIEIFKSSLNERGIYKAYDNIQYEINLVEYPLRELQQYLEVPGESKLNKEDAYIFMYFIREHIEDLIKMAEEIDEKYSSETI